MKTRNTLLAILAAGLLSLSALAVPVLAQDESSDSESDSSSSQSRSPREQREERRDDRRDERRERAQERYEDKCVDRAENLSAAQQDACMRFGNFSDRAHGARREAHALMGAIDAIERRIGRLEVREMRLEEKLASGNFSENETAASVQAAIDTIEEHQARLAERLEELKARVEALHDKWQAVREHVEEKRHRGQAEQDDDEDEDEEHEDDSDSVVSSSSSSTSA